MTSEITLDFIREAAEKKYGSRVVPLGGGKTVELRNPLRLNKGDRDRLTELDLDAFEEPIDYFQEAFTLISDEKGAKDLREALGDDAALYMVLFEEYMGAVELGEASPSQD